MHPQFIETFWHARHLQVLCIVLQYLHFCMGLSLYFVGFLCHHNYVLSYQAVISYQVLSFCAPCTSTVLAQCNPWLLVISVVSFIVGTVISLVIILLSVIPLLNCCFSILSLCIHTHLLWLKAMEFSALSLSSLTSFLYCNNNILSH